MNEELLEQFLEANDDIEIACADCGHTYYEGPTTCTVCWGEGGGGRMSLRRMIAIVKGKDK